MKTPAPEIQDQIASLEHRIAVAYERLGLSRPRPPVLQTGDARGIERHMQWIEKELRGLRRLAEQRAERAERKPDLRERLRRLHPVHLSASIAGLGLSEPDNPVDDFGADVRTYRRLKPWIRFLFEEYWRVELEGLANIPANGAALLVANHGGLLPFDAVMLRYAIEEYHMAARSPRFLIEDWFMERPGLSLLLTRLGAMRGSPLNARRMLDRGELVGLFPEGAKGVVKRFRDRYRVQRFGRGGTIRLALEAGVPIIPVAVVGSEEIYPVLARARLPMTGVEFNFLPLTPTFPWLGPLGALPLPSKWMIGVGTPFDLGGHGPEAAQDDITVNELNEALRGRIQDMVNGLLQQRRSPWLG